jgi:pimeloyl-ACP methyl ester carboxylesterase
MGTNGAFVSLPDGVRLHTIEQRVGSGDPALTVVLLHGWALDARLWQQQIADLPRRLRELRGPRGLRGLGAPARIIAFDLRGHGRSTDGPRGKTTLAQLADDLAAVIRERVPTGRIVLVGHSMGGMAITEYAHRYPDQFAARVAGVVFVATSAEGTRHTTYGLPPALARLVRVVEEAGAGILARFGSWSPHRLLMPALGPGLRWLVFGRRAEVEALRLTIAMVSATPLCTIGGFRPAVGSHERIEALATMRRLPVAVLVGARDRLTPRRCAETIAAALPDADHVVFDDCGHMLPLECPNEVTGAIAGVCRQAMNVRRRIPARRLPARRGTSQAPAV